MKRLALLALLLLPTAAIAQQPVPLTNIPQQIRVTISGMGTLDGVHVLNRISVAPNGNYAEWRTPTAWAAWAHSVGQPFSSIRAGGVVNPATLRSHIAVNLGGHLPFPWTATAGLDAGAWNVITGPGPYKLPNGTPSPPPVRVQGN